MSVESADRKGGARAPLCQLLALWVALLSLPLSSPAHAQHEQTDRAPSASPLQNATTDTEQAAPAPREPTISRHLSSRQMEKAILDRILADGYDRRIRPAGLVAANASESGEWAH